MIYQNHVMQRYIEPFILNNRNKFLSKRIMETYGGLCDLTTKAW